jgi:glycerol uptake facilitator-like aquaporin
MFEYISEFIGTFILVLVMFTTKNWLIIGITVAILLFIAKQFYNASFNPITMIAYFINNDISLLDLYLFIFAEIMGSLAGIMCYKLFIKPYVLKQTR